MLSLFFRKNKTPKLSTEEDTDSEAYETAESTFKRLMRILFLYNSKIQLNKIPELHNELFKTELDYQTLGFQTLESFVRALGHDILVIEKTEKGVFVKPKDNFTIVKPQPGISAIIKSEDVMRPGDKLCPFNIVPNFNFEEATKVLISRVHGNRAVSVQLCENLNELELFHKKLNEFYFKNESKFLIEDDLIQENLICAALYHDCVEEKWYRAKVLNVSSFGVFVALVDDGFQTVIMKKNLRHLHKCFANYPAQALTVISG